MTTRRDLLRAALAACASGLLEVSRASEWRCEAPQGAAADRVRQARERFATRTIETLPRLGVAARELTVSGLSSGAAMAMQLHVAHSSRIRGAGLFAGPAYSCALDDSIWNFLWANSSRALGRCMTGGAEAIPITEIVGRMRRLAELNRIDPVRGLAESRVWLLTSDNDHTVRPAAMTAVEAVYRAFARMPESVKLNRTIPVGHGWPTAASDSDPGDAVDECAVTQPPFFNPCRFPATSEMLRFVLRRDAATGRPPVRLVKFDQKPFRGGSASATGIGDAGLLCLPQPVDANTRLHLALHGCCQSADHVGDLFPIETGLADAAAAFNLAILLPQTADSMMNPKGCWDWWGYNEWHKWRSDVGFDFPTRRGAQVRAIMAMADRLSGDGPVAR